MLCCVCLGFVCLSCVLFSCGCVSRWSCVCLSWLSCLGCLSCVCLSCLSYFGCLNCVCLSCVCLSCVCLSCGFSSLVSELWLFESLELCLVEFSGLFGLVELWHRFFSLPYTTRAQQGRSAATKPHFAALCPREWCEPQRAQRERHSPRTFLSAGSHDLGMMCAHSNQPSVL